VNKDNSVRDDIARKFITSAADNSNKAIKNVWLILFTAGTFAALTRIDAVLGEVGLVKDHSNLIVDYPIISIGLFVIYFLTFFRFYVGDTRLFDVRYGETLSIFNENISQLSHSRESEESYFQFLEYQDQDKFKFEAIFLIFQTLMIVYLAYQILNPTSFILIYILLMLTNSIWLTLSNLTFRTEISESVAKIFREIENNHSLSAMFPMKPGWVWVINNIVTALILLVLITIHSQKPPLEFFGVGFSSACILYIGTFVMIMNCLIDIHFARDFYFPRFSQFYKQQSIHLNLGDKPLNPDDNHQQNNHIK